MRLSADKVKAGILHADQDVREAAVHYFANSFSGDPTVMPLVIQAIEKYGFDHAFQHYGFLEDLVQTDETVRWLIQQLKILGQPASIADADPMLAYMSALVHAEPTLLKKYEDEIMALDALDPDTRDVITERTWFPTRTAEELWKDFEEFCEAQDEEGMVAEDDFTFGCRVVEALGEHRDQFGQLVLDIIDGEANDIGACKEDFAIRLVGEMKLEAAIPSLLAKLQDYPDDFVAEEIERAFTKIGSNTVVSYLVSNYPDFDLPERTTIACTLENIHSDQSVQACLSLLELEEDSELIGLLLQSLLFNFATEGIELARQFILDTPLDPDVLEVRSALLTASKLMGETFPEFDEWLEDSKNDQEFRRKWYEEHPSPDEDEFFDEEEGIWDDDELDEDDFWDEDDEPEPLQPKPIVHQHKKIGRNDPCPCGSGKKYKRCCYGKGFEYVQDDEGTIFKSIPISDEIKEILEEQQQKFIDKFGREPGPDDQVFFDMPHHEHTEHMMVEGMKEAGIDPAIIYAFEKTGRLVTEENEHLLSDADIDEWNAAIEEYHFRQKPPEFPIGTVALYGPDDKRTTKIAAGVILHEGAEAIIKRWVATDVSTNPKVQKEMQAFFKKHGVKSVAMSEGNMGCPHEEGQDFPEGGDCPFCPFWKGKQGSNRKD